MIEIVVRVHTYMRSGTSVNRIANAKKRNVSRVMQRFANFFVKVSCVTNRYRPLRLLFCIAWIPDYLSSPRREILGIKQLGFTILSFAVTFIPV